MAHDDDLDLPPFLDRRNKPAPGGLEPTAAADLPALIVRSAARLMQAKSSAEVLEAKGLAQAALHYARVTKAANETHADCLRIITRADCMRMATTRWTQRRSAASWQSPVGLEKLSAPRTIWIWTGAAWKSGVTSAMPVNEFIRGRAAGCAFRGRTPNKRGRTPTRREIIDGAKAVRQELEGRGENPHVTKRKDTKGRHQLANKRTKCAPQSKRLIGVHWQPDATSATIVHGLLAKLAGHPQHLALCAVLRTFLNEHGAR